MNTAAIEKSIELLNSSKLDELRELLTFERQKSILVGQGKKTSLLTAVKKFIDNNDLKTTRPELAKIQHTEDGKQFIIDGYLAVIWNNEHPELNALPQRSAEESFPIHKVLLKPYEQTAYPLSLKDKMIIENIEKYCKIYKHERMGAFLPIWIFGDYFDAFYLKKLFDIVGTDFDTIYFRESITSSARTIYTDDYSAIFLPMRHLGGKEEEIKNRTDAFVLSLEEQSK